MTPGDSDDAVWQVRAATLLEATRRRVHASLVERGEAKRADELPALSLPRTFGRTVGEAWALERRDPRGEGARAFERHYLEWLPSGLVEQLGRSDPHHARLFRAPLDLGRMPRLRSALAGFDVLQSEAGLPAYARDRFSPGFSVASLYASTHFGSLAPILHCTPSDTARMQGALEAGARVDPVVDRWLVSSLVHELSHAGRDRDALSPPLLDEALAGWFGQRALRSFTFPGDGGAPVWLSAKFTQLGWSFVRTFGIGASWRAQVGAAPWAEVIGREGVDALARIGRGLQEQERALHFLPLVLQPIAWAKAFAWIASGGASDVSLESAGQRPWSSFDVGGETVEDRSFARDALESMCLRARVEQGTYVVEPYWPGEVTLDLAASVVTRPKRDDPLEREAPLHLFPPATAARFRARGVDRMTVWLDGARDLDAAVDRLFEGASFVPFARVR